MWWDKLGNPLRVGWAVASDAAEIGAARVTLLCVRDKCWRKKLCYTVEGDTMRGVTRVIPQCKCSAERVKEWVRECGVPIYREGS